MDIFHSGYSLRHFYCVPTTCFFFFFFFLFLFLWRNKKISQNYHQILLLNKCSVISNSVFTYIWNIFRVFPWNTAPNPSETFFISSLKCDLANQTTVPNKMATSRQINGTGLWHPCRTLITRAQTKYTSARTHPPPTNSWNKNHNYHSGPWSIFSKQNRFWIP